MYQVFIKYHIHHLMNKFKILIFYYSSDWMMYVMIFKIVYKIQDS